MYVTLVHVHVVPDRVQAFVEASLENARAAAREPGNVRFDVLRSADDPSRFILYEAYQDETSSKAHKETAHYRLWRDTVADWMAEPRRGDVYDGLEPG